MPNLNLRYQKNDKFDNQIFIAHTQKDEASFKILKKYHQKLVDRDYDTFLPIYHNDQYGYCTVRFKKSFRHTDFIEGATYQVSFSVKTNEKNDKTYVNCFLTSCKLISKPIQGVDLDLDE